MAFNVNGAVEVSLSVFGSLVTEGSAANLPEGVSPDCQDVVFQPGQVAGRPILTRVNGTPFTGDPVYAKSYVSPKGEIQNLYLDASGELSIEKPLGTFTLLSQLTRGSYAKSVTAFGREYIAVSDRLHGADIPLQWDGTHLDRVTQDGPGAPPTVASVALPPLTMASASTPLTLSVTEADPGGIADGGYFTRINFWTAESVADVLVGAPVTIAGNSSSAMNVTAPILAIFTGGGGGYANLIQLKVYLPPGTAYGMGGTATIGTGTAVRANNVVTVHTTAPHQMKVGYLAQISGMEASVVGTALESIEIKNVDLPGIATVTTTSAHGLTPGSFVTISGVIAVQIGDISRISRQGGVVTIETASPHGLSVGSSITVDSVSTANFNASFIVQNVVSPNGFVYFQNDVDALVTGSGHVQLNWPLPEVATPTYFEVVAAPTEKTFQVQMSYSDGKWTTGAVSFAWNGSFFVTAVPDETTLQYKQYGPDAVSITEGTVTPYGQAAPGEHQCQLLFLTRQGYVTRPSPPVKFQANGGQYVAVENIAIGPENVIARILAFTGAKGSKYFYIPVPAQVNGQVVSTATQIDDNSTTSAVLDFSDNTLFAGLGVSVPGNDLANQIVIDGALGFGMYANRLLTYGQRNTVQSLLNMGFDGGYLPSLENAPAGWTYSGTGGTLNTSGRWGFAWEPGSSVIAQSFYADAYGAPIARPNTKYRFRCWVKGGDVTAEIASVSSDFSTTATVSGDSGGQWGESIFGLNTPGVIPTDLVLKISSESAGLVVDEMSIVYDSNPYSDTLIRASYVENPEAFDGGSGAFGSSQDSHKVLGAGIINDSLYFLTQDPGGQLHEVSDGPTEPSGWVVRQVASNCGLLGPFALTEAQADAASASGGEKWFMWASSSGARIFGGGNPDKISQEIQPDWQQINPAARLSVWAVNDPANRIALFGLPMGDATAPDLVYPLSYRALDSAAEIAKADPVHISGTGHLAAQDNARKWTRWNMKLNGACLMYRAEGQIMLALLGGNGQTPGLASGFGSVYTLSPGLRDDDYGEVAPYYVTHFFVNHETEQALQLGSHRKLVSYFQMAISGIGYVTVTPYVNGLYNPWPITDKRALTEQPKFDYEWGGGQVSGGQRYAFKIGWSGQ